jgi:hypothetical protein
LLVDGGWVILREKYWWLVVDKPSEQEVIQIRAWACGTLVVVR